jgi:hypothetical protein
MGDFDLGYEAGWVDAVGHILGYATSLISDDESNEAGQ